MSAYDSSHEIESRVALALLEALRSSDTPAETLGAEDFSQSLPRRLGLSGVIEHQIRRYRELERQNEKLAAGEVEDLFRLVERRPDAETVFREAGEILSDRALGWGGRIGLGLARHLPGPVGRWAALRRLRGIARRVNPGGTARTERDPPTLIVESCLPARACGSPAGCALLLRVLERHVGPAEGDGTGVHPLCEARGDSACVWRLGGGS